MEEATEGRKKERKNEEGSARKSRGRHDIGVTLSAPGPVLRGPGSRSAEWDGQAPTRRPWLRWAHL